MSAQHRRGFFPGILDAFATVDLEVIQDPDVMAFGIGYLMGKRGLPKDQLAEELGVTSYEAGWKLGVQVLEGTTQKPSWDKS